MTRRVGLYLVGSLVLVSIAGCGRGFFTVEREPWRAEAEIACLKSGEVKESAQVVRISPISGPGACGADFPLKVAALGETSSAFGFADDLRPPGAIPGAGPETRQPRWPAPPPRDSYAPSYSSSSPSPGYGTSAVERRPMAPAANAEPQYNQPGYNGAYSGSAAAPLSLRAPGAAVEDEGAAEAPQAGYEAPERPLPRLGPSRDNVGSIGPVAVKPAATLACPIVSQLDHWITESVQPAAQRWFGTSVVEIKQISAYSCRGMNGNPNAHISEHAFGNALDIAAFTLADGRRITVKDGWHGVPEEQGFLRDVQGAACQQFNTVLAPGSNRYHSDHIHVDLMRRASGRVICQPAAVDGEEVAARAGGRYAGRSSGVTGSISSTKRRYAQPGDGEWVEDESNIRDNGR
jgi:hypothetical protein